MGNYLYFLLILACPLMMIFMMRGMHGSHGGNANGGHAHDHSDSTEMIDGRSSSLDGLRRQRDELDRRIDEREAKEQTPVGGGWR